MQRMKRLGNQTHNGELEVKDDSTKLDGGWRLKRVKAFLDS